ncbi:DUF4141 domain-containing protein [Variovorax gossypii]|jgi:P-type conjugative transfer protein TrbJ
MKSKKTILRSIASAIVVAASMLGSPASNAQWTVIDPANLIENIISAIQSVSQEMNQVKQLQEQVKSNMAGLPLGEIAGLTQQVSQLQDAYSAAMQLKQSLGSGAQALQNIQSLYGASNYANFNNFAQSLAQRKAAGDANATNLLSAADAAMKQIQSSQDSHSKVVSAAQMANGPAEAAQSTTAAVGVVIQQNQAFMGTMAAMAADQGMQRSKETKSKADSESMALQREQENASALSRLQGNPSLWK